MSTHPDMPQPLSCPLPNHVICLALGKQQTGLVLAVKALPKRTLIPPQWWTAVLYPTACTHAWNCQSPSLLASTKHENATLSTTAHTRPWGPEHYWTLGTFAQHTLPDPRSSAPAHTTRSTVQCPSTHYQIHGPVAQHTLPDPRSSGPAHTTRSTVQWPSTHYQIHGPVAQHTLPDPRSSGPAHTTRCMVGWPSICYQMHGPVA